MSAPARISKKAASLTARLQLLRQGPAAVALPAELRELSMTFAARNRDYGARKFMQQHLPSLTYANQELKVNIQRPERVERPNMTLKFKDGNEKTLDLKMKSDRTILSEMKGLLGLSDSSAASPEGRSSVQPDSAEAMALSDAASMSTQTAADRVPEITNSTEREATHSDSLKGTPAPNEGTEQGVALGTERQ